MCLSHPPLKGSGVELFRYRATQNMAAGENGSGPVLAQPFLWTQDSLLGPQLVPLESFLVARYCVRTSRPTMESPLEARFSWGRSWMTVPL